MISSCSAPVLVLKGDCQASSALALRKITRYVFAIYCFFFFFLSIRSLRTAYNRPQYFLFFSSFLSFFFFTRPSWVQQLSIELYMCGVSLCVWCVCLCVCVCMCVCESHYCIFFFFLYKTFILY